MNMLEFTPAYLKLAPAELQHRAEMAHDRMENCDLCARECHINRTTTRAMPDCKCG